ncbi:hypothetical protein L198_00098 [Cryptococcus wingfieldii CBS 7118]|uniref:Uncharacterized protein n=1 Tax=Cryptococcus wingfieldii CBS 7118 TaxID=1295528 RepID=A0A1E3K683_9TREE|nr:hypothetical protein L198_00098 [Cryptococcus wingfieldii CBS 7118]ODO08373.1 hypothetical protein L198_00098 [Cryptococcus wingfieldii CBS 7118]
MAHTSLLNSPIPSIPSRTSSRPFPFPVWSRMPHESKRCTLPNNRAALRPTCLSLLWRYNSMFLIPLILVTTPTTNPKHTPKSHHQRCRVEKDPGEDIAALCSEHAKYEGFVQIKFGSVLAFWSAKRAAERAGGVWLKSEDGSQRITPGVKTFVDTCGRTRRSASTDFCHLLNRKK